jgi:hypothetical protein
MAVFGTEDGRIQVWDLKKPSLLDSFYFDKSTNKEKISVNDKIRSINFTVDERFVVVNNKTQLAYYSTSYLREEKSSSAFKDLNIELVNTHTKSRKPLEESHNTQPFNFFKDKTINILGNVATTENKIVSICSVKDILSCVRDQQ